MAKETAQENFRPLINPDSKMKPLKQLFSGFEIEKKQVLLTKEEDFTKNKNGLEIYNEVLENGVLIEQGYIKDIPKAAEVLQELGINLNDFKPNTIRLRSFGVGYKKKGISKCRYVLTLKDKKETKKREAEFKLTQELFEKYWPLTEGARVQKKRFRKVIKKHEFELDAFTDRILLLAECEVTDEAKLEKIPKLGMDVTNDKNWSNKAISK